MKKNIKLYFSLFIHTFKLSAFTFGGGYVIVPLMKKEFVDKLGWIDEKEMLDYVAIAQSSPGAMAVNASVLVGFRLAGIVGSLITIFATVLPPLVLITVISLFYARFAANEVVANVLRGMQAGVSAVILDVVYGMASKVAKSKSLLDCVIMLLAFAAIYFFKLNIIFVIFAAAVLGLLRLCKKPVDREAKGAEK